MELRDFYEGGVGGWKEILTQFPSRLCKKRSDSVIKTVS